MVHSHAHMFNLFQMEWFCDNFFQSVTHILMRARCQTNIAQIPSKFSMHSQFKSKQISYSLRDVKNGERERRERLLFAFLKVCTGISHWLHPFGNAKEFAYSVCKHGAPLFAIVRCAFVCRQFFCDTHFIVFSKYLPKCSIHASVCHGFASISAYSVDQFPLWLGFMFRLFLHFEQIIFSTDSSTIWYVFWPFNSD